VRKTKGTSFREKGGATAGKKTGVSKHDSIKSALPCVGNAGQKESEAERPKKTCLIVLSLDKKLESTQIKKDNLGKPNHRKLKKGKPLYARSDLWDQPKRSRKKGVVHHGKKELLEKA